MTAQLLKSYLKLVGRPPYYLRLSPPETWVTCTAVMSVGEEFVTVLVRGRPKFIPLQDVIGCSGDPEGNEPTSTTDTPNADWTGVILDQPTI